MSHGVVPGRIASATRVGLEPVARRLRQAGLSANAVTLIGSALTLAGAAALALEQPLAGLALLLAGSLCDTLDGAVARVSGGGTRFGAFLDSTLDRLSDAALFCAAAALGASWDDPLLFWAALGGLVASFLVSYTRAKAESLGVFATVGAGPREARLVMLLAGIAVWAVLGQRAGLTAAVAAVAVLATITLLQRIAAVARGLARGEGRRG